jgi:hypothetical protein
MCIGIRRLLYVSQSFDREQLEGMHTDHLEKELTRNTRSNGE